MKLFKLLLLTVIAAFTLNAQPQVNEQILTANGGDAVAMTSEYAIVGDPDQRKVFFYKLNYSTYLWEADGEYQDSLTNGNLGFSVAIDGNISVAGSPQYHENRIFRFRGGKNTGFEEYHISSDSWIGKTSTPDDIGHGGALAWGGGDYIYALRGAGESGFGSDDTDDFYRYQISTNAWLSVENTPANVGAGGALAWDGGNYIYALRGSKTKHFWRFDLTTETWDPRADTDDNMGYGAALIHARGNIYALRGDGATFGSSKKFYHYNVAFDNWTNLDDTPHGIGPGGALAFDGTHIFALRGNDGAFTDKERFFQYDLDDDTWKSLADMPNGVAKGGALVYDGTFLYAQRGDPSIFGGNNNFWRYDFGRNEWLSDLAEPAAGNTGGGGALTVVRDAPGKGIVYVFERDATTWNRTLRVSLKDPIIGDNLGFSVGVHNRNDGTARLVVGAPGFAAANGTGSATIVHYDNSNLPVSGNIEINASDSAPTGSVRFGSAIDVKGDPDTGFAAYYISVGDQNYSSNNGAAYIYNNVGASFPAFPGNRLTGLTGAHLGRNVAININATAAHLAFASEDNRNSWWNDASSSWNEVASEGSDFGSVSIDQDTILSTNAAVGGLLGEMHFWPLEDDLTLLANAQTFYTLITANAGVASDSDMNKEISIVNDPTGSQAIVMDVPCGLRPTHLIENEWAMVSVPCGDGTASIGAIFGDDLTVGTNLLCLTSDPTETCNWAMYEDGPNYTGKSSDNVQLVNELDTMEVGKGYWIIADHNATLKADSTAITTRSGPLQFTGTFPEVGGHLYFPLPMSVNGTVKKIMVGNPFPRSVDWNFVGVHNSHGNYLLPGQTFGEEYNPIGYVYDSTDPDGSGQPYRAITVTPGFGTSIAPYQAFWIRDNGNFTGTNPDRGFFLPFMK